MSDGEIAPWRNLFDSEVPQVIRRATVPMYCAGPDGILQFDRSAVLLRVGSECFLLTALHDLPEYIAAKCRFFCQPGVGGESPVDISGGHMVAIGGAADVAAVQVSERAVRQMGKTPLTFKDLDIDTKWDATTPFVLCGYPKALESKEPSSSGPVLIPRLFIYLTAGYEGPFESTADFSKDSQLSVTWGKDFDCVWLDGEDVSNVSGRTTMPRPHGVSGGGLWRCGFHTGYDQLSEDKKYRCKLSAIQHSVHRGFDYAVGTRVAVALFTEAAAALDEACEFARALCCRNGDIGANRQERSALGGRHDQGVQVQNVDHTYRTSPRLQSSAHILSCTDYR